MRVPFLDLRVSGEEKKRLQTIFSRVLDHGMLVMGPELTEFESVVSKYVGRKYAVGVASGSDAVFLALKAVGVKKGDEVITTCLSWIATANAIARCGATPVFADIDDDLNVSVSSIQRLINKKTRAILTVDYTGRLCDYDSIVPICKEYNIKLVEDGSQAFGASRSGFKCGAIGDVSAVSNNPMKVYAALGEAGTVFTDDPETQNILEILRYNGTIHKEECIMPSLNSRMDALQAAFLTDKLPKVIDVINQRNANADFLNGNLHESIIKPLKYQNEIHVFYTYTIVTERRDDLARHLSKLEIETKIQHPILMCDQAPYLHNRSEKIKGTFYRDRILSLPIHERLTQDQLEFMVKSINNFFIN